MTDLLHQLGDPWASTTANRRLCYSTHRFQIRGSGRKNGCCTAPWQRRRTGQSAPPFAPFSRSPILKFFASAIDTPSPSGIKIYNWPDAKDPIDDDTELIRYMKLSTFLLLLDNRLFIPSLRLLQGDGS